MLLTRDCAPLRVPGGHGSGFPEDNARLGQVVRGQLHLHFVTRDDADKVLSHLAGDMRQHVPAIRQIHPEHGAGEDGRDYSFYFNGIFLRHSRYLAPRVAVRQMLRTKFPTGEPDEHPRRASLGGVRQKNGQSTVSSLNTAFG